MKLKIGQIDLSFHHVAAAYVLKKLDDLGQEYELVTATHEKLFEKYVNKEVDIVIGAWLPSSHSKYLVSVADETEYLSVLYNPFCIWGVPDYVDENLTSVADILKPEFTDKFNKTIQGINEGAGISRFSHNIIKDYGLDALGFEFKNGSIEDCTNAFSNAYANKQWVIIPLWEPQYLHHSYKIRALTEPKGLLGSVDASTIIVRRNIIESIPQEVMNVFKTITLGNDLVTKLDYLYKVEKLPLTEVVKKV